MTTPLGSRNGTVTVVRQTNQTDCVIRSRALAGRRMTGECNIPPLIKELKTQNTKLSLPAQAVLWDSFDL